MPFTVNCPCGKSLMVKDELLGKHAKCPFCGNVLVLTGEANGAAAPAQRPDQTAAAAAALRQRWTGATVDLLAVRVRAEEAAAAEEALLAAVLGPMGPAERDVMAVRGRDHDGAAGWPFVGLVARHGQAGLLPWFCQCALGLHRARDHHLVLALDHAPDDLLRPEGGAAHVAVSEFRWARPPAAPAQPHPAEPLSGVSSIKASLDSAVRLPGASGSSAGVALDPLKAPLPALQGFGGGDDLPRRSRVREADAQARAEDEEGQLRQVEAAKTVALVVPLLQSASPHVRTAAAEKLGNLGDRAATGPLVTTLRDPHVGVRRKAAGALGDLADPRAAEALAGRLDDPAEDGKVREEAAWSLLKTRHPLAARRVAPTLVSWAREESFRSSPAVSALGAMKDPWVAEQLIRQLPQDCAGPDAGTLRALRAIGAPYIVPPLLEALKDGTYLVRGLVAELLGETRDAHATLALAAVLQEDDKALRKAAVDALGKIGDPDAVAALQKAAHDKSKSVRKAAADALQALGITFY